MLIHHFSITTFHFFPMIALVMCKQPFIQGSVSDAENPALNKVGYVSTL